MRLELVISMRDTRPCHTIQTRAAAALPSYPSSPLPFSSPGVRART